jgi:hypothetical protein
LRIPFDASQIKAFPAPELLNSCLAGTTPDGIVAVVGTAAV